MDCEKAFVPKQQNATSRKKDIFFIELREEKATVDGIRRPILLFSIAFAKKDREDC